MFGVSCRWCRLNEMFCFCVLRMVFLMYYMWKNYGVWVFFFRFSSYVILVGWKKCLMILCMCGCGCRGFRFMFRCIFLFSVISSWLWLWF